MCLCPRFVLHTIVAWTRMARACAHVRACVYVRGPCSLCVGIEILVLNCMHEHHHGQLEDAIWSGNQVLKSSAQAIRHVYLVYSRVSNFWLQCGTPYSGSARRRWWNSGNLHVLLRFSTSVLINPPLSHSLSRPPCLCLPVSVGVYVETS